jgi:hypothetical protein
MNHPTTPPDMLRRPVDIGAIEHYQLDDDGSHRIIVKGNPSWLTDDEVTVFLLGFGAAIDHSNRRIGDLLT